jgi:multicomponent Na+:H+ antiporter subunit G
MLILGAIITLLGSLFLLLGSVGILRMPDVYNRMQAGTKASTLGTILALLGIGIILPEFLPRMIVLIVFVLFTNPIGSHALARAAHRMGVKLTERSVRDELKQEMPQCDVGEEDCNV